MSAPIHSSHQRTWLAGASVLAGGLLLQGCAVGPDFVAPKPPLPATVASAGAGAAPARLDPGGHEQQLGNDTVSGTWWTAFGSPELNDLVTEALHHNPRLTAARNSLQRARDVLKVESGIAFWPSADLQLGAGRQRILNLPVFPTPPTVMYGTYGATVGVNYTLDLFGGQRRTVEAAGADVEVADHDYQAARLSLAANVCNTAIGAAALAQRIALAERAEAAAVALRDAARQRRALGQVTDAAVLQAEHQLAAQAQLLPGLRGAHQRLRSALAVMLGRTPDQAPPDLDWQSLTLPTNLPDTVPSQLVRQRPDIQAAEARLHSATAMYGAAISNLYPQIQLGASWGRNGYSTSQLMSGPPAVWHVLGGLTQPLFRAGALEAAKRAAGLDQENALASYLGTVLLAWQNVADVRQSLTDDAALDAAARQAQEASARQWQQDRQRAQLGSVPTVVLQADAVTALNDEGSAVTALAQRYVDTVTWYQALSGPIVNR
jgi:NodT family efflux transporter outer membrane factor (OMF) lipoprotein